MNEIGTGIAPNEITPLIDFIVTALVPLRKTYTMLNIHGYFHLKQAINILQALSEKDFTKENIKKSLMQIADKLENRGGLLHPVRYALSGKDQSPDPFIIAEILGKNETLSRLQKAV